MAKKVRYNGGNMSYYGCTDPVSGKLVIGKEYEVIYEEDRGWQTNYYLKGVKGYFNSCWFDEVETFMALSYTIPVVGKRLKCYKLAINSRETLKETTTSTVMGVIDMGNYIYQVTTRNSIYLVQLIR